MYLIPLELKMDTIYFKLATGMKMDPNKNYLVLWETFAGDDNISSSPFFTHSLAQSQTVLLWGIWFRTHLGNISGVSRAYSGIFRNNTGISQAFIRYISGIYQASIMKITEISHPYIWHISPKSWANNREISDNAQENLRQISGIFHAYLGISLAYLRCIWENYRIISRIYQPCLKQISGKSQANLRQIQGKFQANLRQVSVKPQANLTHI